MHTSHRIAIENLKVAAGLFLGMCLWFMVVAALVCLADRISVNDQASLAWPVALMLTVVFSISYAAFAIKQWPKHMSSVLLGVVTIAYTVLCVFSIYNHLAYRNAVLEWRSIGGVETPWELAPKPVPENQNAYFWYERAINSLPIDDSLGQRIYEDHGFPWNESAQSLMNILAKYEASLKEYHTGTLMQKCVMPVDRNDVWSFAYPPLGKYHELANASLVEAVFRYHQGDVVGALERLQANNAFVGHLLDQHRGAMIFLAAAKIECRTLDVYQRMFAEGLDVQPLPSADRQPFEWRKHLQQAYLVQGTLEPKDVEKLIFKNIDGCWFLLMSKFLGVAPGSYRIYLKHMISYTEDVHKPHYEMDAPREVNAPVWGLLVELLGTWHGLEPTTARIEVKQLQSLLAVRLREYKIEYGDYPDTLDMIASDDLSIIDPWSGKPMHYERVGEGFLLRSEAMIDDKAMTWQWQR